MLACERLNYSALEEGQVPICPFRVNMQDNHCTLKCAWLQPTTVKVDSWNTKTVWHCALLILGAGLYKKVR